MPALREQQCQRIPKGTAPLTMDAACVLLAEINSEWKIDSSVKTLQRTYSFKNFYETMAFVNALAWIAHQADHHPDLAVAYKHCVVTYSTHDVKGLSHNDFVCAAKIDHLVAG